MRLTRKSLVALLLAAVALVGIGGATLAFAAPAVLLGRPPVWPTALPWGIPGMGHPDIDRGAVAGTVKSVSASELVLTMTGGKTVTVTVTSQTKVYVLPDHKEGKLADIKAGDTVHVMGQANSAGVVAAQAIMVGVQAGPGRGWGGMIDQPWGDESRVAGQVTAVDGAKITVQAGQSTQTIVTDANTTFMVSGGQAGTLADVKTGVYVMAHVQKQADDSLLASQVMIGAQYGFERRRGKGGMMGQPRGDESRVAGQVTAVDGAKITVQAGQTTQTIVTNANTKFVAAGGQAGALADVKTGVYVMALGNKQPDGSWLAAQVIVMDKTNMGPGRMWEPQDRQRRGFPPGPKPTVVAPSTNS